MRTSEPCTLTPRCWMIDQGDRRRCLAGDAEESREWPKRKEEGWESAVNVLNEPEDGEAAAEKRARKSLPPAPDGILRAQLNREPGSRINPTGEVCCMPRVYS